MRLSDLEVSVLHLFKTLSIHLTYLIDHFYVDSVHICRPSLSADEITSQHQIKWVQPHYFQWSQLALLLNRCVLLLATCCIDSLNELLLEVIQSAKAVCIITTNVSNKTNLSDQQQSGLLPKKKKKQVKKQYKSHSTATVRNLWKSDQICS